MGIWSFATSSGVFDTPALSSDDKVVYVGSLTEGSDASFYAVNTRTGSEIWSFAAGGQVVGSPTLSSDGKFVYVGSSSGSATGSLTAVKAVEFVKEEKVVANH